MTATAPTAHAVYLSDVAPERLRWLSRGRLAAGKLTILDGDPGLGKSTLLADWAARITRGEALPDGAAGAPRGVVLLSAEDGLGDTIRPRLEAAGADLGRVLALQTVPDGAAPDGPGRLPGIPLDLAYLEAAIRDADAALLIVDPLMAYLGGETNAHRDQDVRRALAPLAHLAERTGVAVVLVRHLNKAAGGSPLYRGGGSIGIVGAARFGLLVAADPDDPERRVLAPIKCNLARPPAALAFRLATVPGGDVARVEWLGDSPHSAGALLADAGDDGARSERDEAKELLRDALADGPVAAKEMLRLAGQAGIAERTLKRAKHDLGVRSERAGFGADGAYTWALPGSERADPTIGSHNPHSVPTPTLGPLWPRVASYAAGPENGTVCLDCGGPCPADGMHRCSGCCAAATPGVPSQRA